jgi:hypothetical protein
MCEKMKDGNRRRGAGRIVSLILLPTPRYEAFLPPTNAASVCRTTPCRKTTIEIVRDVLQSVWALSNSGA